jgi:hypothetical protein
MFRSLKRLGVASTIILAATACDFEVTNPGPTDDAFLDNSKAHQAVANGSARTLFDALNEVSYTTSSITRELFPAGSTSSFGISNNQQAGLLQYDDEHIFDGWLSAQRSRYIGESGFARFAETHEGGNSGYKPAVEAALYAAYASRLIGENWCEAAIDGGAIVARADVLKRAETWFTTAIDAAGSNAALATQKTAAIAGRASVRVQLGDWTGAVADAAQVPTTFVFNARYEDAQQDQFNRIYFSGADQPYRAVTVWNTPYQAYYTATNDPRVPWNNTGLKGDASVGVVGARVDFYRQAKFPDRGSDIRLSSGYEMRLIEAENKLRGNDMAGAMTILNARRTALGLAPWTPANMTEAWTNFKRERGIELWLEGRRLGDLFRWKAEGTPGALDALETAGSASSYLDAGQNLCYPIPKSEREANPNISVTP